MVSTAGVATSDVVVVEVEGAVEVTTARVVTSEVGRGAVFVVAEAGALEAVAVGFFEAMSSWTFAMRSGSE